MLSFTEENYLKAIVQLTVFAVDQHDVGVNKLASYLEVKPATVSDMVRKLKDKELVSYEKYGKVSLTKKGRNSGMLVIRRHRLWETFLHEKLNFSWDEVHELAEQLEHVHTPKLIDGLDEFLGFPQFDPHGDAIPNAEGEIIIPFRKTLTDGMRGKLYAIVAVRDESVEFLRFFKELGLKINSEIKILDRNSFDQLTTVEYNSTSKVVSPRFTDNVYVVCAKCKSAKGCDC